MLIVYYGDDTAIFSTDKIWNVTKNNMIEYLDVVMSLIIFDFNKIVCMTFSAYRNRNSIVIMEQGKQKVETVTYLN